MLKTGCYKCKYRGEIPGDAHSCCHHPDSGLKGDPMSALLTMLGGRAVQTLPYTAAAIKMGIKAHAHGVKSGWFNWPFNFDPVWLDACDGFTQKGATK